VNSCLLQYNPLPSFFKIHVLNAPPVTPGNGVSQLFLRISFFVLTWVSYYDTQTHTLGGVTKIAASMDEKQIIRNIKRIRQSKKISLVRLAKLCGLTKGYVSKIENSDKAPPLSTLSKIANALDTDISLLLANESELPENLSLCIVKKNERKEFVTIETRYGYHCEALAHKKIWKNMEPYIILPVFREKGIFSHEGEEFIYVLEGRYKFSYDGKKYLLSEGDSIYFDSIVPHSGRSLGKKKAKILAVIYSYKRR
jgi:transcriptional regulator with XRE-family HTH domain